MIFRFVKCRATIMPSRAKIKPEAPTAQVGEQAKAKTEMT